MEPPPVPPAAHPLSALNRRARRRIRNAKNKARPELKTKEMWYEKRYFENFDLRWQHVNDTIERIDVHSVCPKEFIERFEAPSKPVAITGVLDNWQAKQKWTMERLMKKYRNQKFKCGEDNEGYSVKLKMKYYVAYAANTIDDSPLYVFDSSFGDVRIYCALYRNLLDDVFFNIFHSTQGGKSYSKTTRFRSTLGTTSSNIAVRAVVPPTAGLSWGHLGLAQGST